MIFDTKLDTTGIVKGLANIKDIAGGMLVSNAVTKTTQAVVSLGKEAITVGSSFETAMSQVAATMGITSQEIEAGSEAFEKLRAKAKEMGATTKYTAAEAAEGLNILAMSGLKADEAISTIPTVMALAGAGAMDLSSAASYVTGTVKGFADSMDNAGYYADLMAEGATLANTNVSQLGEAMSTISATANSYGQKVDSVTLSLLRLAEQNVTGSEAATALKRAMTDLYTPTDKAEKTLKKLGIAVYDDSGNARDFNEVVDQLNTKLSTMSEEEANVTKSAIFTSYGLQAFNKMTVTSEKKIQEFTDALKDCSGAAMQQFETQTDNLQGKMDIFQSTCESVGIAIYDIFSDNLKDAMDGVTDSVSLLEDSISNGELGDALEELAEVIAELVEKGAEIAVEVIPKLVSGLTFLLEHIDLIVTGLEMAAAGYIAYQAAVIVATIATQGFTAALALNPIGLIAAACAAAVVGLAKLYKEMSKLPPEVQEIVDTTDAAAEKTKRLNESSDKLVESIDTQREYIGSLKEELAGYQDELDGLADGQELDVEKKERINEIVRILNSSIQDLNLQVDEQGRIVGESADNWEDYIETMLQLAEAQVMQEKLNEITEQKINNDLELLEVEKSLTDAAREYVDADAEMLELISKGSELTAEEAERYEELDAILRQVTDSDLEIIRHRRELIDQNTELGEKEAELTNYMSGLTLANQNEAQSADAVVQGNEAMEESTNELAEAQQKLAEKISETIDQQLSVFEEFKKGTAVAKDDILANMQSQIDGMSSWKDNITELSRRGVSDGVLAELAQMGPQGTAYVDAFMEMTTAELGQANFLYKQEMKVKAETAAEVIETFITTGEDAGQGYVDGMDSKKDAVSKEGEEVGKAGVEGVKKGAETHSPSRVTTEVGENVDQGLIDGMENKKTGTGSVEEKAEEVGKLTVDTVDENAPKSEFVEIGERMDEGLAEGIRNGESEVIQAATDVATAAIRAAKDALGIHSPSRVFQEIGDYCIAGFEKPFDEFEPSDVFEDFKDGINAGVDQISLGVESKGSLIDYEAIGSAMKTAMQEIGIFMDSILVGQTVAESVNDSLALISARRV